MYFSVFSLTQLFELSVTRNKVPLIQFYSILSFLITINIIYFDLNFVFCLVYLKGVSDASNSSFMNHHQMNYNLKHI